MKNLTPTLPSKPATALADVLCQFLKGRRLTSRDAWLELGTSRLAAQVHVLKRKYGWGIQSADVAVPTSDGRTAVISEYWLTPETIIAAHDRAAFIEKVSAARAVKRKAA